MIKKLAVVLTLTVLCAYTANISIAQAASNKPQNTISAHSVVYNAIGKYKQKNYTGVIQELSPYILEDGAKYKDKNNKLKDDSLANYYLGLAYTQLGMKGEATTAFNKVIELDNNQKLVNYSNRAIACLNDQPQCSANYVDPNAPADDDMTVFIRSGKFLHSDVQQQVQDKSLDKLKDQINNDMAPDTKNYKFLNDASGANVQPTDEEIANAVRVLAKVGLNPLNMTGINPGYANPQMAQLAAIMGNTNTNNNMNSYLPYIISQGASNPESAKQMIQTMMMGQMMPEFGMGSGF